MYEQTETVEQLENQKEHLQEQAKLYDAYERLMKNKDFRLIIMENFIVRDCARNVAASVDPNLPTENRAMAMEMARAAGFLKQYLASVNAMNVNARSNLRDVEQAINEIRNEGAGE